MHRESRMAKRLKRGWHALTLLDQLHWLWLGLAAPFMLFPTPKRSLVLLVVPGLWLLGLFANRRQPSTTHRSQPIPNTPLNAVLLLLAVMVLVSEWATYDLAFSLPKISGMVLGLGVFFAVARESQYPRGWLISLTIFLGLGVGMAGIGLLGTNWFTMKFLMLNSLTSSIPHLIQGLQGAESGFNPNTVAGTLTWIWPPMVALSVGAISPQRMLNMLGFQQKFSAVACWLLRLALWLATLFVGGVFMLTQSRSAYIGIAVALFVMLFLASPRRGRWILLSGLMLAVIVSAVLIQRIGWESIRIWVMESPLSEGSSLSLNSLEGRMEIWTRAIYGIQDFPFTGMGMNTFRKVVPLLYPLFTYSPDADIGHAHNEFLQAGLDLGIPGLIAFLALYVIAFRMLARLWTFGEAIPALRTIILGLGGGLLAHLVFGLTDAIPLGARPGVVFWYLLGLIAGLYNLHVGQAMNIVGAET